MYGGIRHGGVSFHVSHGRTVGVVLALTAVLSVSCGCQGGTRRQRPANRTEGGGPVVIQIVYDNNEFDPELSTAWGFACVVKGYEKTILFDTGADGGTLLSNMEKMAIEPADIDVVVLSHIHDDHTGGLDAFLAHNGDVTVVLPESFPESFKENARRKGAEVVDVHGPATICQGARSTGQMGRNIREQGLCLETREGLVVITGCAHPGIVAMVERAKTLSKKPVHLVMGGFHLSSASVAEVAAVIARFRELGVRNAAPCHCSGDRTRQMMEEAFGQRYLPSGVGASFQLHGNGETEEKE